MVKRLVVLVSASLALVWLTAGAALAQEWSGKSEVKRNGSYTVELITPAEGLSVGVNNLAVQLKNTAGQPVVRDSVRVDVLMDESDASMGHGDMSQQEPVAVQLAAVKGAPGRYSGTAELSDTGTWKVRVFADDRGVQAPVTFSVTVSGSGPSWVLIGGLLVLVAAAVASFVVIKRKPGVAAPTAPSLEATEA